MNLESLPKKTSTHRTHIRNLGLMAVLLSACSEHKPVRPAGYVHFNVGSISSSSGNSLVYVIADQSLRSQPITAQVREGSGVLRSVDSATPTSTVRMDRICCPNNINVNIEYIGKLLSNSTCTRIADRTTCASSTKEVDIRVASFIHPNQNSRNGVSSIWLSAPLRAYQGGGVVSAGVRLVTTSEIANQASR